MAISPQCPAGVVGLFGFLMGFFGGWLGGIFFFNFFVSEAILEVEHSGLFSILFKEKSEAKCYTDTL